MASISRGPNGRRTIQFVARDAKRRSIRLGKVSQRTAETVKLRVEALNGALISGTSLDNETASWVSEIGDELAEKLADVGLISRRASTKLGSFIEGYIALRSDIKPNTRRNLETVKARLVEFFGEG